MKTQTLEKNLLFVNFGGPRSLDEVPSFLEELLTDGDVIRTPFPKFLQDIFFKNLAKKRAKRIAHDYSLIGGKSPIYEDTEWLAEAFGSLYSGKVIAFHRYLKGTHTPFLEKIKQCQGEIIVFPLFPQFSFATTGSIARWLRDHLDEEVLSRLSWVKSYGRHPAYIACMEACIREFMQEHHLKEEESLLFFSPHGLPKSFVEKGDPYQSECEESYQEIRALFPKAGSVIGYQSQFGKSEWVRPYTVDLCESAPSWASGHKNVIFIPLSFTSDHIETLFEVQYQYLPLIERTGAKAYRCPALNRREDWLSAIGTIAQEAVCHTNDSLIRR